MGLRQFAREFWQRLWPRLPEHWYKVAPTIRHSWEYLFQIEDPKVAQIFNEDYATRLSEQGRHFSGEIARIGRNVAYADALLLFMVASKGKLPDVYGFPLSSLFFAAEAVVIWTSIGFAFAAISFINYQAYEALLRQWCANRNPQDPDYLLASYVPAQLLLRILRPRLSSPFGSDRLRLGRIFAAVNKFMLAGVMGLTLTFVLTHFAVVGMAISQIWLAQNLGWWATIGVVTTAISSNLFGFLLVFLTTVLPLPVRLVDLRYPILENSPVETSHSNGYTMSIDVNSVDEEERPPIVELEKKISDAVNNLPKDEQIKALTKALAYAQLWAKFERTHSKMFGSQILALQRLAPLNEASLNNAREFYSSIAATRNSELYKDFPFEKWLSFLVNEELVFVIKENASITELGREFLRFLDARGYTDNGNL